MTAHLPGLVQDTPIKSGGVNLLLWAHPPPFISHIMRSWCFHKKASEIKHGNFIVDILVYDELKNVVQNLILLRKLKVPLPKIRPFF
jgi:hypothetical protein